MTFDTRSFSVRLRAEVLGYVTGMNQAATATKTVAQVQREAAAAQKKFVQEIGRASVIGGVALLGLAGAAVKTAADFDKAMSGVRAATHETAANMDLLRAAALRAGADTAFTATDAADAEKELAKAGLATSDVLSGGLKGALSLAAAGQLEVGQSAEIAATAMTQFGLSGKDIPHVADLLAAGAGKAQGEVSDLAHALQYVGPVAHGMGVSLEQTVGTLALFAKQGQIGERAGTGLRGVLLSLTSPGQQAAAEMKTLGINLYDASGQFVGLDGAAQQLRDAFVNLTPAQRDAALGTIFGNQQVTAARVLYEGGAAAVDKWTNKVNDAGYAAKTAAIQQDNLRGDLEKLGGSLQTALIDSGSGAGGGLRGTTQAATGLLNAYTALPGPAKTAATTAVAVAGAAGLAAGGFLLLAPRIVATRASLAALAVTAPRATAAMSTTAAMAGKLFLGLAAGLAAYQVAANALGTSGSDLDQFTAKIQAMAGPDTGDQITALQTKMEALKKQSNEGWLNGEILGYGVRLGSGAYKAGAQVFALSDKIKALKADQKLMADGADQAGVSQETFASALSNGVTPAAQQAADALKSYTDALADTKAIDAYTATANLAKSFQDLSKTIKTAGTVTNDEKIALGGFASDVKSTASAVFDQTQNQGKANAAMATGRKRFVDLAEQAGYSAKEAKHLADRLGLIKSPPPINVQVTTTGLGSAIDAFSTLQNLMARIDPSIGVRVPTPHAAHARGGYISGPGGPTSDAIPAYLSDGEYVVRAAAVARYGTHFFDAANAMRFAAGGAVDARRAAAAAAAAQATAGRASRIDRSTPGTDSVADITAAIAAVQRLTDAYAAQQAVVGMSKNERRKYHAEARTAAVAERLDLRKTAAETRTATATQLADNQASWEFDHMTAAAQITALDKKIAGEKKYSDAWVADSKQREQITADMAAADAQAAQVAQQAAEAAQQAAVARLASIKADLDAAIAERDSKIAATASIFSSFGNIGSGINVPGGPNEIIGSQVGATDVLSGGLIAASQAAKAQAARLFITDLRALKNAGLNTASLQEILGMGPAAGAAYAAALVSDMSVLGSINSSQSQLMADANFFGAELAGNARFMVGSPSSGPTTFNIVDSNGVLLGTMYGAAQDVASQIANSLVYGRAG